MASVNIQYNIGVSQAQAALASLEARMTRTTGIISTQTRIADGAIMVLAGSFMALGAGAFVAYNAVNQFQESLTSVRALGGVTKDDMNELADTINRVSMQFGVSGDDIARGTVMLSKAGLTVNEVNESIEYMTALSKANGIAFEEAARMTVFAVNVFDKEFSETKEILDAMQVATQESILDVGDLQKAFAYAGSTAHMAGVSYEQLISIMAVLSNRALEAGIASRSVNQMFLTMIAETDKLQDWMNMMGHSFQIIRDGKLDIDALIEAFEDNTELMVTLQGATDVFSTRALRSFGLLIGASTDYQDMLKQVENSQGALADVVEVQMESFTAMFAKLKQELLAPLRTPEVIEAVGLMVENFINMFEKIGPDLIDTVLLSLTQFSELMANPNTLKGVEYLAGGMFKLFQALDYMNDVLTSGGLGGKFLKYITAIKLAQVFMLPFIMLQRNATLALQENNLSLAQNERAYWRVHDSINAKSTAQQREIAMNKLSANNFERDLLMLQRKSQAWNVLAGSIMGSFGAAMMMASTESDLIKGMLLLTAVIGAANASLMIFNALNASKFAGVAAAAAFAINMGVMYAVYTDYKRKMEQDAKDLEGLATQYDYEMKDTGGTIVRRRGYDMYGDTGLTASQHRLIYVEEGETIIPKTQNMLDAETIGGGGININIAEMSVADGTDFAQKIAETLPFALRMSSDRRAI